MRTLKIKATKMLDPKVSFVSLVERGANRIPFRVIKQEKTDMTSTRGLDLANLFHSKKAEVKPEIIAYVTMKGDNYDEVVKALKGVGIDVSKPVELSDKSVVFKQGDVEVDPKDTVVIKANDDVAVIVKGFCPYDMQMAYGNDATFEEVCKAQGFYPGVSSMLDVLRTSVMQVASKADDPEEAATDIATMFDEAKAYVTGMVTDLPVSAFKAEAVEIKKQVPPGAQPATQFLPTDTPSKDLYGQGTPGANSGIVPGVGDTMAALLGKFGGSLDLFKGCFPKLASDAEKDMLLKAFASIDLAFESLKTLKGSGVTYTPPVANVDTVGKALDAGELGAKATGDVASGGVTAGAAGAVTEHKEEKKEIKKDEAPALPDFAKIVSDALGAALAPVVTKMDSSVKALGDQIGVVAGQVTEAMALAKKADDRVRNVLTGQGESEDDDPVGVMKGIRHEYMGREIDTAFHRDVRKSAR